MGLRERFEYIYELFYCKSQNFSQKRLEKKRDRGRKKQNQQLPVDSRQRIIKSGREEGR